MQKRRAGWLPAAACLLLGLAGGLVIERTRASADSKMPSTAHSSPSGPAEAAGAAGPASTLPVAAKLDDRDKEALRQLIRQELQNSRPDPSQQAAAANPTGATTPADAQAVAPILSDEQEVAYERARSTVDDGIARGSWTEDDRTHLRETLRGLPPDARDQVMRTLVLAVNQGRIQPQIRGPLF